MKGFVRIALISAALSMPAVSRAQVYGQFSGAEVVPTGGHLFGAYLHASEDLLGLLAQLRLSFYPNVDFGFQGGLTRIDMGSNDRTTLRLGADVKFVVLKADPVDLSASAGLGVETGDEISILTVGPSVMASRTIPMGSGGGFVPYAGLGLLFSNVDIGEAQDTDFSVPFRFGAEFRLSPEIRLVGEIQLRASDATNDSFSFVTGVNLPF